MPSQRLCLRLDSEILLERLILERLAQVPKSRRPEWLRSLLVSGFLSEGRACREVGEQRGSRGQSREEADRANAVPRSAFGNWLGQPKRPGKPDPEKPVAAPAAPRPATQTEPRGAETEKPFAHLCKVIG